MVKAGTRDHLFINYATEDGALAEWLTLKLSGEGYRVWCMCARSARGSIRRGRELAESRNLGGPETRVRG